MRIDIISVLPELMKSPFESSILKRAIKEGHAEVCFHPLHEWGVGRWKKVDDAPYGGGAGMVMTCGPIDRCILQLKSEREYDEVIYLTPDGERLNQKTVNTLSTLRNVILLCGHYKGIDQRIRQLHVTREVSIGDYVLTGGELAACVLADAMIRLIPGVLHDEQSALTDSFQDNLLSPPIYTRPEEYRGLKVPEVLLGGNAKAIDSWKHQQALEATRLKRPDLLED